MREAVEVILVFASQRESIDPLSQQFDGRVANLLGMPRIVEPFGQRFDETQFVIGLTKQHGPGTRSNPLLGRLHFDSPVEFRLE